MFRAMTVQLMECYEPSVPYKLNSIPVGDYEQWQKEYTWDALLDQRYGRSFCRKFGVDDNRLHFERDWVKCDSIIRNEYLERP